MAPDTWNDNMVPFADYLELSEDEREEKIPFIWSLDRKQHLSRLMVSDSIVKSAEDRRDFWIMLKGLVGIDKAHEDPHVFEEKIRREVVANIAGGLMQWATGSAAPVAATVDVTAAPSTETRPTTQAEIEYIAPWLDTEDCSACGECIKINPEMFAYNENGKAYILNPDAGPYQDLVKAAERCTAQVIHPGLPRKHDAKDIDKWIKRADKFNS